MPGRKPKTPKEKMRDYRSRLRAAGLRPIQLWVPDTRAKDFASEARRQSILVSESAGEREAIEFIEVAADFSETK